MRKKNSDLGLHRKRLELGRWFRYAKPSSVRKVSDMTRTERGLNIEVDDFMFTFQSRQCMVNMLEFYENYPENRRSYKQQDLPVRMFNTKKIRNKVIKALYEALGKAF